MANSRVRLTQQTIESVTALGDRCGIEDFDTVIKLLVRKYGDQLAALLAPNDPNPVNLSQPVPRIPTPDPKPISPVPIVASSDPSKKEPAAIDAFLSMEF